MKILSIKLFNINSLRDREHTINFKDFPFNETNLFAITGETGAGKTTILDAVTLALYGRVARDCDVKEVISYGASEAYTEVEFKVSSGSYRARWSIARARKKIDGNLQDSKRELADITESAEGIIIAEKKTEVHEKIVQLTQLGYEQFTKSVLLAQGDFAAFLKAKKDKRGQLLERVTGTEIYSDISKAAYEKAKYWEKEVDQLKQKLGLFNLLSEEQFNQHKVKINQLEKQIIELRQEEKILQAQKNWFEQLQANSIKFEENNSILKVLLERETSLQPEFKKLKKHLKTIPFHKSYQDLKHSISHIESIQNQNTNLKNTIHDYRNLLTEQSAHKYLANDMLKDAQEKYDNRKESLEEVIALDIRITEMETRLQKDKFDYNELKNKLSADETKLISIQDQCNNELEKQEKLTQWFNKNKYLDAIKDKIPLLKDLSLQLNKIGQAKDFAEKIINETTLQNKALTESLLKQKEAFTQNENELSVNNKLLRNIENDLAELIKKGNEDELLNIKKDVESKLQNLEKGASKKKEWVRKQEQYEKLALKQKEIEAHRKENIKALEETTQKLTTQNDLLQALEDKYKLENAITNYEAKRTELIDGEPCPLCGSEHHPYAHELPQVNLNETKNKLEASKFQFNKLNQQQGEYTSKKELLEHKASETTEALSNYLQEITDYDTTLKDLLGNAWSEINFTIQLETLITKLDSLNQSIERLKKAEKRKNEVKERTQLLSLKNTQLDGQLKEIKQKLSFNKKELDRIKEEISKNKEEQLNIEKKINSIVAALPLTKRDNTLVAFISNIESQLNIYQNKTHEKEAIDKHFNELNNALNIQHRNIENLNNTISLEKERITADFHKKETVIKYRNELFPEKDITPKALKNKMMGDISKYTEAKSKSEIIYAELNTKLIQAEEQLKSAILQEQSLIEKKEKQQTELEVEINAAGFSTWEEFTTAELNSQEAERIDTLQTKLREDITRAQQSLQDTLKEKEKLEKTSPQFESVELVISEIKKLEDALEDRLNDKQELEFILKQDNENRLKLSEDKQKLDQVKKEYEKWEDLNGLIGSASGDKFRIFAQTLTLERLVRLANQYLSKLYERYIIEVKNDDKLGLQIIDTYQADHVRSMETLSGGESFIVSLGLALGLSDMAGKNASIGTLFIDEGFGTLDPSILDLVITTLENLQSMGKTIGVISHVEALKERIQTQVFVKKQSQGVSTIEIIG